MRLQLLLAALACSIQPTDQTFMFFGKFNKGAKERGHKNIPSIGKTSNIEVSYKGPRRVKYQTRLRN